MEKYQKFTCAWLLTVLNEWHAIDKENIAGVQRKILGLSVKAFDASTGALALLDEDGVHLTIVAGIGLPQAAIGSLVRVDNSLVGKVITSGKPLLLNGDVRENPEYSKFAHRRETARPKSSICWPLRIEEKIIGVISINRFEGEDEYGLDDVESGTIIIGMMAIAFENSRLQCDQHRKIAELSDLNRQLSAMNKKLDEAHSQLVQSEKMASIGQLAAGVAHEINNPIGYVNSNLTSLADYLNQIFDLLGAYERVESVMSSQAPEVADLRFVKKVTDISFLKEDIENVIKECREGIGRVHRIVQSLKTYSYMDRSEWEMMDVRQCIEGALTVINSEIKSRAEIVKNYAATPLVECHPSQINQVMVNILMNASQSLKEHGIISISTGYEDEYVWIEIADTGCGIAHVDLSRIFDPFYTTKQIGEGTGLGLSISSNIIKSHNGRIDVESELGRGSKFRLWLPIAQARGGVAAAGVA